MKKNIKKNNLKKKSQLVLTFKTRDNVHGSETNPIESKP